MYDTFVDLVQNSDGYTDSDGRHRMMGGYGGILHFEVVKKCLAHVPVMNEANLLAALNQYDDLTPIHSLLHSIAKTFFEVRALSAPLTEGKELVLAS